MNALLELGNLIGDACIKCRGYRMPIWTIKNVAWNNHLVNGKWSLCSPTCRTTVGYLETCNVVVWKVPCLPFSLLCWTRFETRWGTVWWRHFLDIIFAHERRPRHHLSERYSGFCRCFVVRDVLERGADHIIFSFGANLIAVNNLDFCGSLFGWRNVPCFSSVKGSY